MRKSKYAVELTEYERAKLRTLIGRGAGPARTLAHARILLRANRGEGGPSWTDAAIVGALEVHSATVARVRRAYVEGGLKSALERKAPDRVYSCALDGAAEARLVALTCGDPPRRRDRAVSGAAGAASAAVPPSPGGRPRQGGSRAPRPPRRPAPAPGR